MRSSTPEHRKISEALRQQIAAGKFAEGRRLPSEMELARRYGVSRPTVARAMRDLESLRLVTRRVGSGTYLMDGEPAPSTRSGSPLGLLVPGLGNTEILDPICNEITRFGQSNGYSILWGETIVPASSADRAEQLCHEYIESRVAGVFFAPLESAPERASVNLRIASTLRDAQVPIVLLDRDLTEFPVRSGFDLVGIDNFAAGVILTQHLIGLGHRRFLFFARPCYPATTDLRCAGCRDAIARASLDPPKTAFGDPSAPKFVQNALRLNCPDAIICSNDRTAAALIQTLSTLRISIPEDISIAAFDDVKYASLLGVPLTTMRQPCLQIGQAAVRAMRERIDSPDLPPRQILLSADLVIRQSCGASISASRS
ncbi:MAG: GntR family transcriptional regulator [Terracidiphilus sp.]|nr:GntR family transcriptional regulator [Terracidiphilus sp.]